MLIDCSASMAALDAAGGGSSGWTRRRNRSKRLIDNLLPDQQVALDCISLNGPPTDRFHRQQAILKDALAKLDVVPVRSQTVDALRMAQALAHTVPIERVLLVSDGNVPTETDFELPFELVFEQVPPGGTEHGNHVVQRPPLSGEQWEVFVGVEGSARLPRRAASSSCFATEVSSATEPVLLVPGHTKRLVFRLETPAASSLEARLTPDGFDSLGSDNMAYLQLPKSRPLSVFVPSKCPLSAGRSACRRESNSTTRPRPRGGTAFDLVVSNRPEDVKLEGAAALFVGFVPKELAKLVSASARARSTSSTGNGAARCWHTWCSRK